MSDIYAVYNISPQALVGERALAALVQRFNVLFPTDQDCLEELYRRTNMEKLLRCRYCKSSEMERRYGDRVGKCKRCKKSTWFTGGTFFNHIRAARPWLLAIWLMEQKVIVSSARFHRLAGIAQSSALHIFKKITTVVQNHMQKTETTVPSTLFSPVFCKRSRETPARKHPLSEQEEMEKSIHSDLENDIQNSIEAQAYETVNIEFVGLEKEIIDILSTEPIHVDSLCQKTGMPVSKIASALTMLELAGVVKRVAGDRYVRHIENLIESNSVRINPVVSVEIVDSIDAIISFIRQKFHGVSRKCLQNYLAAYWLEYSKNRWQCSSLLELCWHFGPLSPTQLSLYVSPLQVMILANGA
ncbi:MAG: hypothetical protein K2W82_05730 [Candidatus Obscuribacterales bacterium]|nr:hypothetical protein [Candidatus Obscuribacterales bacterium]